MTSVVDGGEWLTPRSGRFNPGTHLTDWVGPGAGLYVMAKRKTLFCWKVIMGRPSDSLVTKLTVALAPAFFKEILVHILILILETFC